MPSLHDLSRFPTCFVLNIDTRLALDCWLTTIFQHAPLGCSTSADSCYSWLKFRSSCHLLWFAMWLPPRIDVNWSSFNAYKQVQKGLRSHAKNAVRKPQKAQKCSSSLCDFSTWSGSSIQAPFEMLCSSLWTDFTGAKRTDIQVPLFLQCYWNTMGHPMGFQWVPIPQCW